MCFKDRKTPENFILFFSVLAFIGAVCLTIFTGILVSNDILVELKMTQDLQTDTIKEI